MNNLKSRTLQESKKIKILYTIPNFDTAGSGKVLYDLAKYLDKNKFEVEIACQNNKGSFFKEVQELGLRIHIIKNNYALRPYWTIFFRIQPLVRFLKSNKIDIVHSWNWSSNWTEIIACKLANVSYVYTKKAMNWGFHWKIKSFLADFIITINDEMKYFFSYKKNQKLIPIGIDTAYFDPKLFLEKPNKDNKFQIITVANLVAVKNIEVLINAIQLLNLN